MNTCRTCKFWSEGNCDYVNAIDLTDGSLQSRKKLLAKAPDATFAIDASADDASNLQTSLRTGPDFGCIHHVNPLNEVFEEFEELAKYLEHSDGVSHKSDDLRQLVERLKTQLRNQK